MGVNGETLQLIFLNYQSNENLYQVLQVVWKPVSVL